MRFCRLFLIAVLCSAVCIGLFSVSSFASVVEYAPLPDGHTYYMARTYEGETCLFGFESYEMVSSLIQVSNCDSYVYRGDAWVFSEHYSVTNIGSISDLWVYDNTGLVAVENPLQFKKCDGSVCPATDANKDNVCDDCGCVFAVPRDYGSMTVPKLMSSIVTIFNSCISWVGSVGSTILVKPILLFYAALPLCGIGVGFFKRLKS